MTVATVEIPNKAMFSRAEAMRLLGVSQRPYDKLIETGVLRVVKLPGFSSKRMVPRSALVEALERLSMPSE